jgi:hypothetical protein
VRNAAVATLERMNTGEVKLRDAGARQRGQDARAARSALVEPGDEGIHLGFHPRRGRGLEVNLAVVKAAGYDALGLVCSITADYFDAPFPLITILCHSNIVSCVSGAAKVS